MLLTVVLLVSVTGFTINILSFFGSSENVDVSKQGGTFNAGLVGTIKSLNPLYVDFSNVDRSITSLMFSGLSKYDPISREFVADLATYELSDNKKKYTFTLKEGIKWHDGKPLTVNDVLFTYNLIQSEGFQNAVLRSNFAGVSIKKENESQISFTLNEPNTFFITNTNIGIIPEHIYKDVPIAELIKSTAEPIGSGPFRLAGPKEGNEEETIISLVRFKDYYNELPKFETVKFKVYPYFELLLKNISHLHSIEKLAEADLAQIPDKERFTYYPYELPQYMAVFFNFASPLMNNKNMRIAAMKAVNRDEILEKIPGKSPIDNPLLSLDQSEWFFKHNPDDAKGALYSLGWRLPETDSAALAAVTGSPAVASDTANDSSAIRVNPKGEKLVLRLIAQELPTGTKTQTEQNQLIAILKSNWGDVGIEVRDEYYILTELQERIKARDYDMLLFGVNMGYNLDIYANWHSSQTGESGLNFSNFKSFEADALIENIRQTFEAGPQIDERLNKLRSVIADDFPAVFLYTPEYYFAADKRIQGVDIRNLSFTADRFAYFDKWYITE